MNMSPTIVMPFQNPEKFPATRPERIVNEAPPSLDAFTISATWRELLEVKTFVNSGINAPARVPQEMIVASFHQSPSPIPSIIAYETTNVTAMETMDVSQTSVVKGASKLSFFLLVQ